MTAARRFAGAPPRSSSRKSGVGGACYLLGRWLGLRLGMSEPRLDRENDKLGAVTRM